MVKYIEIDDNSGKSFWIEVIEIVILVIFNFIGGYYFAKGFYILPALYLTLSFVLKLLYIPATKKRIELK